MKVGALFYGYGGIELGLRSVTPDLELAWFAEFDPKASLIGAHHYPGVPNLGDVTKVDWATVPKVDIITGGSPCQDLSHAGKRKGMTDGTRSNLWVEMREAIAVIRPRLVVWENVRGALSAPADSDLEPCPGCVGDGDDGPVLRALGRVLGDLAELGYDARWYGLRAAGVGAPHGRFRVFLFATPAHSDASPVRCWAEGWDHGLRPPGLESRDALVRSLTLLPTPRTSDTNGAGHHGTGGPDLRTVAALLPTLRATDGTKGGPNQRGSSGDLMLPSAVGRLLPTPRVSADRTSRGALTREGHWSAPALPQAVELASGVLPREYGSWDEVQGNQPQDWREYEPAIRRWETVLGRPAPAPTEPGAKGQPRLSPLFVEWLMGLPAGHVTDVPGLTRNDQLKALGNGVVPQQCAAAYRAFLNDIALEMTA